MKTAWDEQELKELAAQFRCPTGEAGLKTGRRMFETNLGMLQCSLDALGIESGDAILEIGMGIGKHISSILGIAEGLSYVGVEMSPIMIEEARRINQQYLQSGDVHFALSEKGRTLAFAEQRFDKVFSVNTIYFWEDPSHYLNEIARIMKASGRLVLTFADAAFMAKLPFSQHGFRLYHLLEVEQLFSSSDLEIEEVKSMTERDISHVSGIADREILTIVARKRMSPEGEQK